MPKDHFAQRKKDTLIKKDKSSKQCWDKRIASLCKKINSNQNFYTTSSCSGRIVIMVDQDKKAPGLFKFISHDLINFGQLKEALQSQLNNIKNSQRLNLKFKQEPCIIHIACRTLEDAKDLLKKAQTAGWKRSGIISSERRSILELMGTNKLEFPITKKGELLVGEEFLNVVIERSNKNIKENWDKIKKLEKIIRK